MFCIIFCLFYFQLDFSFCIKESKKKVEEAKSEVENVLKIVNDTREDVKKQETELQSAKLSWAERTKQGRSNARNVAPDQLPSGSADDWHPAGQRRRQQAGPQQQGGNSSNRRPIYGSSVGNGSGVSMGAPLPSRY